MKYTLLATIGFTLWLTETAYFGWNETAQSTPESILDTIAWLFIVWGILGDILNGLQITKNTIIDQRKTEIVQPPLHPNCRGVS